MLKGMKSQRKIRNWRHRERVFIGPDHANDNKYVGLITGCSTDNRYPHRIHIHSNGTDEFYNSQLYKICLSHKGDLTVTPGGAALYREIYYFIFSPESDLKKMGELHVRYFKQRGAPDSYDVLRVIWDGKTIYNLSDL